VTAEVAVKDDSLAVAAEAEVCVESCLENLQAQNSELLTSNKQHIHVKTHMHAPLDTCRY